MPRIEPVGRADQPAQAGPAQPHFEKNHAEREQKAGERAQFLGKAERPEMKPATAQTCGEDDAERQHVPERCRRDRWHGRENDVRLRRRADRKQSALATRPGTLEVLCMVAPYETYETYERYQSIYESWLAYDL